MVDATEDDLRLSKVASGSSYLRNMENGDCEQTQKMEN